MVENKDFTISWTLVARAKAYSSTTDCCRLCLKEKSLMILQPHLALLNDRDEFFNHCRHKNKLLLSSIIKVKDSERFKFSFWYDK